MPIPGTGVVPGSGPAYDQLNAVTRRAFIPKLVVQIYYASPTLMMLLGGAQKSAGGLSQITIPVQGASMVQGAWMGYTGTFNKPQAIAGMAAAQFNTCYFGVPVPIVMGESLIQSTEAVVPIIEARMNDVYAVMVQQLSSSLFTNNSANPLMPDSFASAFDDGSNVAVYGGINRNGANNTYWRGQYYGSAGNVLTRQIMSRYHIRATDAAGGEAPNFVVMSPGDFATLSENIQGIEQVNIDPGARYNMDTNVRSAFPNITINGVPFFMDHWCPTGTIYQVNTKYTALYLSEDVPFAFSGFYSAIPTMQVGQVGICIVGLNVVSAKPVSGAQITGVTGAAF